MHSWILQSIAFSVLAIGQESSDSQMNIDFGGTSENTIVVPETGTSPTTTSITSTLSKIIYDSATVPIPEDVRGLTRSHILDTVASIVACKDLEGPTLARNYSLSLSGGAGQSAATIAGSHEKASIIDAAFAGAMAGHGAEINDFIPSAFVQPGPAIVSVSFAVAETRGLSGEAMLRAIIIGYELASKVPKALGIKNLQRAGIANHGLGSTFGSAAAAASLMGLSAEKISHMLSYCSQQASGSWQWLLDVEHIEKTFVFAGMGAKAGLSAALMAEAGFRGVRNSLDDPKGWVHSRMFTGGDEMLHSLLDVNNITEMAQTGFKMYPVGGPAQPAVHGLLMLLPNITANQVSKIIVAMPGAADAFRNANMPALNLKYLLAIILLDGRLGFVSAQSQERMLGDRMAQDVMSKVNIVEDKSQEAAPGQPRTESARVTVEETGGKRHDVFVPFVKGYPSHPMTKDEVNEKALGLMAPHLGARRASEVVEVVNDIEKLTSIKELLRLIAR